MSSMRSLLMQLLAVKQKCWPPHHPPRAAGSCERNATPHFFIWAEARAILVSAMSILNPITKSHSIQIWEASSMPGILYGLSDCLNWLLKGTGSLTSTAGEFLNIPSIPLWIVREIISPLPISMRVDRSEEHTSELQ